MGARVVVKLGGGLITDKTESKTFDHARMAGIAEVIAELSHLGSSIVIVHGAGSYGHLLAKEWSISEGFRSDISLEQKAAVSQIRSDMRELNALVITSLNEVGLECESHPPSDWALGTGQGFQGSLSAFQKENQEAIPVTFGDVVDTNDGTQFGILSGDDLMLRISNEVPGVTHSIFLIGDADGVMDKPPNEQNSKLLPLWRPGLDLKSNHDSDIDVTGGINLKLMRASDISKHVGEVWIINGTEPTRLSELLIEGQTIGTKILAS